MTTFLADGNVLIALVVTDHVHHGEVTRWFVEQRPVLATCPITEGTLLRFLVRSGISASESMLVLDGLRTQSWHRFWPADLPFQAAHLDGVLGHRQITDAYLVALGKANGGRLVTLDRGIAALHADVELLVP